MPAYLRLTIHSHSTHTSDEATNNQLKFAVVGLVVQFGVTSWFVADDSLSILKMHRVGLAITITNPVISSLENNCTIFTVEF
jgi:hypothetical protein